MTRKSRADRKSKPIGKYRTIIIGLDQSGHVRDKNRSKADAVNITVVTFPTRKTFNKRDSSAMFDYDPGRSPFRFSIRKILPSPPTESLPLSNLFDPPGVSRRTRTNVTRSNVTLIRFRCKTYDPPIMVRSHLPGIPRLSATQIAYARHAARIIDIDWCRRAALIALQTLPDRRWNEGIIAATLISSHVAPVTRFYSTLVSSFLRGKVAK